MASLFSVSRLIGNAASKRPSSEDDEPNPFSCPPTPCRNNKTEETLEEPGYNVVLQISNASFEEWTESDEEAGGPAESPDYAQFGIDRTAKEQSSGGTTPNWTPLERAEESPLIYSAPDWTNLEIDGGKTSEDHLKEERMARLQETSILKEEKGKLAERLKELEHEFQEAMNELTLKMEQISKLVISQDQKEMEIEAALEREESLLVKQNSMKEKIHMMIGELSESQARVAELKSASEVQTKMLLEKNVVLASHSDTIGVLKGEKAKLSAQLHELKSSTDNERRSMQTELDMKIGELSKSQARVAELESASDLQAMRSAEKDVILANQSNITMVLERQKANLLVEVPDIKIKSQTRAGKVQSVGQSAKRILQKDAVSDSHSETIEVLKGQKATLLGQVEELRAIAQVNERQNHILLVQLGRKFDDDDVIVYQGSVAKPVRRTNGPTLVEHAVRIVKTLNDHVYQFAASLTDYVDEIGKKFVEESDGAVAALETPKTFIGTKTPYTHLEDGSLMTKDEYNPFIIKTGFQACLTACCMHIITLWDPAEPEYGEFLEVVYKKVRGLKKAENAAQWRNWILRNCRFSTKTGMGVLSSFIIANLHAMLSMAGWTNCREPANLQDKFSNKISEIVNLAIRLNELAAERIIPGDLQVTTIEEGANYLSQDMIIDCPEGEWDIDTPTPYSQVVVACVGFGLKWRQGDIYERLVLKPRVIVRKVCKPFST